MRLRIEEWLTMDGVQIRAWDQDDGSVNSLKALVRLKSRAASDVAKGLRELADAIEGRTE